MDNDHTNRFWPPSQRGRIIGIVAMLALLALVGGLVARAAGVGSPSSASPGPLTGQSTPTPTDTSTPTPSPTATPPQSPTPTPPPAPLPITFGDVTFNPEADCPAPPDPQACWLGGGHIHTQPNAHYTLHYIVTCSDPASTGGGHDPILGATDANGNDEWLDEVISLPPCHQPMSLHLTATGTDSHGNQLSGNARFTCDGYDSVTCHP